MGHVCVASRFSSEFRMRREPAWALGCSAVPDGDNSCKGNAKMLRHEQDGRLGATASLMVALYAPRADMPTPSPSPPTFTRIATTDTSTHMCEEKGSRHRGSPYSSVLLARGRIEVLMPRAVMGLAKYAVGAAMERAWGAGSIGARLGPVSMVWERRAALIALRIGESAPLARAT